MRSTASFTTSRPAAGRGPGGDEGGCRPSIGSRGVRSPRRTAPGGGPIRLAARPTHPENQGGDMPAKGSAEWKGDVPTGTGTFTAGDTISGGYTFKSRFEDVPDPPRAADRRSARCCFSMAVVQHFSPSRQPSRVRAHRPRSRCGRSTGPHHHQIDLVTVGRVAGWTRPPFRSMRRPRRPAAR